MLSITLRQLEYATATARHGSVTAAALSLHVSQPALSVALGLLEAHLGRALFLRRPGGRITPTSFGRGWIEAAEIQLAGLARLGSTAPDLRGEVRLAVFEDLAAACLAPLLAYAATAAPHLVIVPQVLPFEPLAEALRRGRADLALTWDLGLPRDITRQTLADVPPHAVLAPDHPLALNHPLAPGHPVAAAHPLAPAHPLAARGDQAHTGLRLADLAPWPLVLTDQGASIAHMRALFAAKGLVANIAHRTASLALMRSYAANGLGVGLSYTNPAARISDDGKAVVTRTLTDAGTEPLVLARLGANPLSAAAGDLAALLPAAPLFAAFRGDTA